MISAILLTLASGGALAKEPAPRAAETASAVEYHLAHNGSPTVVFESGLGFGIGEWLEIIPGIRSASAFAYNRPGYGDSKPSPDIDSDGKRTASEVAGLLYRTLQDADVTGPLILVAHSLGALYALEFAEDHPDLVSGIVLVDGRPKHYQEYCHGTSLPQCAPQPQANWPAHIRSEALGTTDSEAEAPDLKDLFPIPITLITATAPVETEDWEEFRALWTSVQNRAAAEAPNVTLVVADGAGHFVHKDRPDIVVREIQRLVDRANGQTAQ